jgi:hypothetical protein
MPNCQAIRDGVILALKAYQRLAPSPSSDAVKEIWKEWKQVKFQDGGNVYAVMFANKSVALCWQKRSGGLLYRISKSSGAESAEFELPRQAFAMVPISDVVADVRERLTRLLGDNKTNGRQRNTSVGC